MLLADSTAHLIVDVYNQPSNKKHGSEVKVIYGQPG
jgi:hypothetical protein